MSWKHQLTVYGKFEWKLLINTPKEGVSAGPFGDDFLHWQAVISGPPGTPYEDGLFMLNVEFPTLYPFKPPQRQLSHTRVPHRGSSVIPEVLFTTPVYHPNIDSYGRINLDILRDRWAPSMTIDRVLMSVRWLLADPNPDDPLVPEIGHLLKTDPVKFDQTVREWTRKYAT